MSKLYGYARCSTTDNKQDINRQIRELKAAGVAAEDIYYEYEHGTAKIKPELDRLFETMKAGDTLIVLEVSRLSRSTQQLCKIIDLVREQRLKLEIINSIVIDCRNGELDPMTNAFLQMSGVFSELERNMISERVKSGMANAKAKGKKVGRPIVTVDTIPETFLRIYPRIKNEQLSKMEAHKITGLSRVTINRYLQMLEQAEG